MRSRAVAASSAARRTLWLLRALGLREGMSVAVQAMRGGPAVRFRDGATSYWMARDDAVAYHLRSSVRPLRELARFVPRDASLVVDVGANSGLFSAFAAERAPGARVVAIEPDSSLGAVIRLNARNHRGIEIKSVALLDEERPTTLFRNASSLQTNSVFREAVEQFDSTISAIEVQATTLDRLFGQAEVIDVLKIDVQGAEELVLRGARGVLPRVRVLLIEVSFLGDDPGHLLNLLRADFGAPTVVNLVRGGADLAYERAPARQVAAQNEAPW